MIFVSYTYLILKLIKFIFYLENDDSNDESSSSSRRKSTFSVRVDRPFLVFIIKKGVISLSARVTKPCFC